MNIGILALQGAFIEHKLMLDQLDIKSFYIKNKNDLSQKMDGLILPGGESTSMRKLLDALDLFSDLKTLISNGLPTLGTCAGMILLAETIENDDKTHFGIMPITVKRNAYGRQLGSFHTLSGYLDQEIPMVFIRAPYVTSYHPDVKVLSEVDHHVVACQYKHIISTAFHPELSNDLTVLKHFLSLINT